MPIKETSVLLLLLLFSINIILCFAITCKDESGKSVDWFVVYKIPKLNERKELSTGLSYAFVTSSNQNNGWTLSERSISNPSSLFGTTILPLYSKSGKKYTKLLYSDQTPDGKTSSAYAHAKGVIAMDADTGFWLTHSIPKYPTPFEEVYKYPESGDDYGQTALCISFSTEKEGEDIIKHLLVLKPKIYSSFFDKKTMDVVPSLERLKNHKWSKDNFQQNSIKSLKNNEFIMFAKSPKAEDDLYGSHIAPFIDSSVFVESWRRGSGTNLLTSCKKYNIINVDTISLNLARSQIRSEWSYKKDHSKWLVGEDRKKPFICIADLNRMKSQNKRGGGAVCFRNENIWKMFYQSIAEMEPCPKN